MRVGALCAAAAATLAAMVALTGGAIGLAIGGSDRARDPVPAGARASADPALVPFTMNHRAQGSLVDLSFLLDAPAGKDGFIRTRGRHFVTPDGRRVRFWGVNLTDWSKGSVMVPSKEDAPIWAASLARFGVNCVRLHFLDLDAPRGLIDRTRADSRGFDAEQLDREDFFIAELKKRGIYVNLNLNVGRSYKAGDEVRDHDRIRWGKGLTLFDPRLIALQKEYARALLTHYNPYTKSDYRHEPAIAIVELVNENALYVGFRAPTPFYEDALTARYNAWLGETLTPARIERLRTLIGTPRDAPVPRLTRDEVSAAPEERFDVEASFYSELERRFFLDMRSYLVDTLGVRAPIVATADHAHAGSSYPLLLSASQLDVVDGHTYWQHPGPRGIPNTPMVNDPFNSTVVELSRTAFAEKPYTVSEVNHPYPNEWGSEGIPILAAYAGFHDWAGVFWYTFEPKRPDWPSFIGDPFDLSHDPVKLPQLAAGALLFARGDVQTARRTIARSYSRDQVYRSTRLPRTERPYFTPGFPLALPLLHGSRIQSLEGPPTRPFETIGAGPFVSDTGEITWSAIGAEHARQGRVIVDTPRALALIGHTAPPLRHDRIEVRVDNPFCAIVLGALDGRPIATSERLLLTAGARVANTGMTWNDTRTALANWGGAPTLIEPVTGTLVLRQLDDAVSVRVTALDGAGRALGDPMPAAKTRDGWTITLGEPATTWYVVTVGRAGSQVRSTPSHPAPRIDGELLRVGVDVCQAMSRR